MNQRVRRNGVPFWGRSDATQCFGQLFCPKSKWIKMYEFISTTINCFHRWIIDIVINQKNATFLLHQFLCSKKNLTLFRLKQLSSNEIGLFYNLFINEFNIEIIPTRLLRAAWK